jgi:hypothetical protein
MAERKRERRIERPAKKSAEQRRMAAAEAREAKIQQSIKARGVPGLKKKLYEHSLRESLLTGVRRGTINVDTRLKTGWLCNQEMRSVHFINLVKAELESRGEKPEIGVISRPDKVEIYDTQMRIIKEGMKKAKS